MFTACGGGAKNRGWWAGGPVHHNEGKGGYHVILLDLESVSFAASDTEDRPSIVQIISLRAGKYAAGRQVGNARGWG